MSEPTNIEKREAMEFADLCAEELAQKSTTDWHERRKEVESSLQEIGMYSLSFEELEHGARVAWRNIARCIGRLFWSSIKSPANLIPGVIISFLKTFLTISTSCGLHTTASNFALAASLV